MDEKIEEADIVVDLSGGRLLVDKLRERIKTLKAELNQSRTRHDASCHDLLSNIDKLEKEKCTIQSRVEALDIELETAKDEAEKLKEELDKLRPKDPICKCGYC